jgi:hypothetical protein
MEAAAGGTAGTASTRAFRNGHMRLGRAGAVSPGLEGTATINDGIEAVAGGRVEATSGSAAACARAAANGKVIETMSVVRAKRVTRRPSA